MNKIDNIPTELLRLIMRKIIFWDNLKKTLETVKFFRNNFLEKICPIKK